MTFEPFELGINIFRDTSFQHLGQVKNHGPDIKLKVKQVTDVLFHVSFAIRCLYSAEVCSEVKMFSSSRSY